MKVDQSDWPEHLRDDAPCQRCDVCRRKTWDRNQFEGRCGMPQPNRVRCPGVFRSLSAT